MANQIQKLNLRNALGKILGDHNNGKLGLLASLHH
jgi:hypothetical protein